jgi:serine/threonine protein kinase
MANNKDRDLDASIGDQNTFQGQAKPKMEDLDTKSLGDHATFAGGRAPANPKSLGDQVTFGGGADQGDFENDDMEIVDLATRYKVEKALGKGGMGEVLLATDTRLNRKTIKCHPPI